jgi:hypothetical protein
MDWPQGIPILRSRGRIQHRIPTDSSSLQIALAVNFPSVEWLINTSCGICGATIVGSKSGFGLYPLVEDPSGQAASGAPNSRVSESSSFCPPWGPFYRLCYSSIRRRQRLEHSLTATPSSGSAAQPLILIRIDLGPQPDQLDSHGNDLVCKQPLRICAETVRAAKALNGALNFRQGTGDRRWNDIRVMHMFI